MKRINVRISDDTYQRLVFQFKEDDESISQTIRRLLSEAINSKLNPSEKDETLMDIQKRLSRMEVNHTSLNHMMTELHTLIEPVLRDVCEQHEDVEYSEKMASGV